MYLVSLSLILPILFLSVQEKAEWGCTQFLCEPLGFTVLAVDGRILHIFMCESYGGQGVMGCSMFCPEMVHVVRPTAAEAPAPRLLRRYITYWAELTQRCGSGL